MIKRLFILFIILSLIILTACSKESLLDNKVEENQTEEHTENETVETNEDESSNNDTDEESIDEEVLNIDEVENFEENEDIILITHENNPFLELATQGRIDNIEFGIGSQTDKIVEEWGQPDENDYFLGGLFFKYDNENVVFFTDAYSDNGETIHGQVKCIGFYDMNQEIYGVKLGMTFDEIISVLGKPTYVSTSEQNEESELLYGSWSITYDTGDHTVDFVSYTEEGPVETVYLWGKNWLIL